MNRADSVITSVNYVGAAKVGYLCGIKGVFNIVNFVTRARIHRGNIGKEEKVCVYILTQLTYLIIYNSFRGLALFLACATIRRNADGILTDFREVDTKVRECAIADAQLAIECANVALDELLRRHADAVIAELKPGVTAQVEAARSIECLVPHWTLAGMGLIGNLLRQAVGTGDVPRWATVSYPNTNTRTITGILRAVYEGEGSGPLPASLHEKRRVLPGCSACGASQRATSLAPEFFDGPTTTDDRSAI